MLMATSSPPNTFVCMETVVVCVGDVIVDTCDVTMASETGSERRLGLTGGLNEDAASCSCDDDVSMCSTDVITSSTSDSEGGCCGEAWLGVVLLEAVDQ